MHFFFWPLLQLRILNVKVLCLQRPLNSVHIITWLKIKTVYTLKNCFINTKQPKTYNNDKFKTVNRIMKKSVRLPQFQANKLSWTINLTQLSQISTSADHETKKHLWIIDYTLHKYFLVDNERKNLKDLKSKKQTRSEYYSLLIKFIKL